MNYYEKIRKYFGVFLLPVISTYQEPIRGWIDNLYGPTGVAAGAGTGLLRSIHCDGSISANVVPADLTINALIACAWDIANTRYIYRHYFIHRCNLLLQIVRILNNHNI